MQCVRCVVLFSQYWTRPGADDPVPANQDGGPEIVAYLSRKVRSVPFDIGCAHQALRERRHRCRVQFSSILPAAGDFPGELLSDGNICRRMCPTSWADKDFGRDNQDG